MNNKSALPSIRKQNTTEKVYCKLTAQEIDGVSYRLSRPNDIFNANKAANSEKGEFWSESYFKVNGEMDKREPCEKLQEVKDQLANEKKLGFKEKLHLLIRIKALVYIIYGENSYESLKAHAEIGFHYNRNSRYSSALRHFSRSHRLRGLSSIRAEVTQSLEDRLNLEISEANYELFKQKKVDQKQESSREVSKHLSLARKFNNKIDTDKTEELSVKGRSLLLKARIANIHGEFDRAMDLYDQACIDICDANNNEPSLEIGNLHVEIAINAEYADKQRNQTDNSNIKSEQLKKAGRYYKTAYEIYIQLGLDNRAEEIKPKLPKDDDVYEPSNSDRNKEDNSDFDSLHDEENNNAPINEYIPVTTDGKDYHYGGDSEKSSRKEDMKGASQSTGFSTERASNKEQEKVRASTPSTSSGNMSSDFESFDDDTSDNSGNDSKSTERSKQDTHAQADETASQHSNKDEKDDDNDDDDDFMRADDDFECDF